MPGRTRDLRRAQRKPKRQAAWISCGDTPALIQCVIWDLTEGGARLARPADLLQSGHLDQHLVGFHLVDDRFLYLAFCYSF